MSNYNKVKILSKIKKRGITFVWALVTTKSAIHNIVIDSEGYNPDCITCSKVRVYVKFKNSKCDVVCFTYTFKDFWNKYPWSEEVLDAMICEYVSTSVVDGIDLVMDFYSQN